MGHQNAASVRFQKRAHPLSKGYVLQLFVRMPPFFGPSDPARICHIRDTDDTGPAGVVAVMVFAPAPAYLTRQPGKKDRNARLSQQGCGTRQRPWYARDGSPIGYICFARVGRSVGTESLRRP